MSYLTKEQILAIATNSEFHVHKYKWGPYKVRKMTRRMAKDGLLELVRSDKTGFYYRTPKSKVD